MVVDIDSRTASLPLVPVSIFVSFIMLHVRTWLFSPLSPSLSCLEWDDERSGGYEACMTVSLLGAPRMKMENAGMWAIRMQLLRKSLRHCHCYYYAWVTQSRILRMNSAAFLILLNTVSRAWERNEFLFWFWFELRVITILWHWMVGCLRLLREFPARRSRENPTHWIRHFAPYGQMNITI